MYEPYHQHKSQHPLRPAAITPWVFIAYRHSVHQSLLLAMSILGGTWALNSSQILSYISQSSVFTLMGILWGCSLGVVVSLRPLQGEISRLCGYSKPPIHEALCRTTKGQCYHCYTWIRTPAEYTAILLGPHLIFIGLALVFIWAIREPWSVYTGLAIILGATLTADGNLCRYRRLRGLLPILQDQPLPPIVWVSQPLRAWR
jgi:hypothetical protein